jgi:DNA modification methylase
VTACRSCGAEIRWARTFTGKLMPLDAAPNPAGNVEARPAKSYPDHSPLEVVANHTHPGAHILDPFAGSGSTLIAAHNLNRVAHLVELDPVYCDVIVDRWARHTQQEPTRA